MTEEDVKLQYITPAIQAKWGLDRITMETKITDGRINLKGNIVIREKPKKADYVLYLNKNKPIAMPTYRSGAEYEKDREYPLEQRDIAIFRVFYKIYSKKYKPAKIPAGLF